VNAVPKSKRKAKALLFIGNAGQAILTPTIRTGTGLIVGEVIPGVSVCALVFANSSPLAFAHVWPPKLPLRPAFTGSGEPLLLSQLIRHSVNLSIRDRSQERCV